jgi:hypothetical protein
MAELSGKKLRERAGETWTHKEPFNALLSDIYDFVMPYRDNAERKGPAAPRNDRVFDATAPGASFRFAGRLQRQLLPPFQPAFALEAGPLIEGEAAEEVNVELQRVQRVATGALSTGPFHMAAHEMFFDLYAGNGALYLGKGNERQLIRAIAVPFREVAFEEGPWGEIWGVYWKRKWRGEQLKVLWPKGRFSEKLKKSVEEKPREEVPIWQYTYYDPETERWELRVWAEGDDDEAIIWKEDFRTKPWVTPRFFKIPGEPYGRGPAHLALPLVKTVNKVRELALIAAAFAVFGLWMRRNDSVFNPDTARMEPKAMWTVSSTGGPLGPAIARLSVPENFDISSFVIADEREQMKRLLLDDALPPIEGAVRSPTEIAERISMFAEDLGGVFPRLALEIVHPVAQRAIDILEQFGIIKTSLTIDQLLTQVRVIAPIAAGQQADKVKRHVEWWQMGSMMAGPQAMMLAGRIEELLPEMARWMGIEERFLRTTEERKQLQQMVAQMIAMQQAAAAAPAANANGAGAPGADAMMNGAV